MPGQAVACAIQSSDRPDYILDLVRGYLRSIDVAERIAERRAEYERNGALTPPPS